MDDYVKNKLKTWSLEAYLDNFSNNAIDEETFLMLTPDFTKELIPAVGPRMKFLSLHRKLLEESSNLDMQNNETGTSSQLSMDELNSFNTDKILSPGCDSVTNGPVKKIVDIDNIIEGNQSELNLSPKNAAESNLVNSTKKAAESNFKVKEAVLNHPQGKELCANLSSDHISLKSRRLLCRIMVSYLIEKFGQNPSPTLKTELSKSIVREFPNFEDRDHLGHLVWFSRGQKRPATGYIEERLRNVRKKLRKNSITIDEQQPDMSATTSGLAKICELPQIEHEDEGEVMIDWLKANTTPYSQVKEYMKMTATLRQKWIKSHPNSNIGEIFLEFPRLKDIPGMIEQDFSLLYPDNCENLVNNWSKYCQKIKQQALVDMKEITLRELKFLPQQDNNEILENACIYALPYLVPSNTYKAGKRTIQPSTADVRSAFIVNVGVDIKNIEEYVENSKIPQPHIVTFGDPLCPTLCYVVVEKMFYLRTSLVKAVDTCFKTFYVVDLGYPQQCKRVWELIQDSFYKIIGKEKNGVSNVIRSMRKAFECEV